VTVASAARTVEHGDTFCSQPCGELVYGSLRSQGDSEMREPHAFDARRMPRRRQTRCGHQLDSRTGLEREEAGFESLRRIDVARANLRTERSRVERAECVEIVDPKRDVLDARH